MANSRAGRTIVWIFQIWVALAFVVIGVAKFRSPFWLAAFPRWGYSAGFRMLIGVLEIGGGFLIAFPRTATYGAILIDLIMIGAAATLARFHEPMFPPLFWLVTVSIVGFARRRRAWRPAASARPVHADTI